MVRKWPQHDIESTSVLEWLHGTEDTGDSPELGEASSRCKAELLAEGDSWFAYPLRDDIIETLERRQNLQIRRIADHGHTVSGMLAPEHRDQLFRRLRKTSYDLVLFSGGGNDILDDIVLDMIIRSRSTGLTGPALLDRAALDRQLLKLEVSYQTLLTGVAKALRNSSTKIITHTYDFVWPRYAPYSQTLNLSGPWIHPTMVQKGITDPTEAHEITKAMLLRFKQVLMGIAQRSQGRLIVVDTQGTLGRNHWRDEIHPNAEGAKLIADKLYKQGIEPHLPACARTSR